MIRPDTVGGGGRRGLYRLAAALGGVWCLLAEATAHAHGTPTPLTFWGGFGPTIARCQRAIGRGGAVCGLQAWRIRRACRLAPLLGATCDAAAADAAVDAARVAAVDAIPGVCTEQQVAALQFVGIFEAQSDVVRFCRELDAAATSAVFNPLPADPATLPEQQRSCVLAAARASTKLLHFAFRDRQHLLDRIALGRYSPPQKRTLVERSTRRIAAAATALDAELQRTCRAETFRDLYDRDVGPFLTAIANRGDCLAGATYAQDGILCPPSVCGNGMQESGEECDDGNQGAGDGCTATCTREERRRRGADTLDIDTGLRQVR